MTIPRRSSIPVAGMLVTVLLSVFGFAGESAAAVAAPSGIGRNGQDAQFGIPAGGIAAFLALSSVLLFFIGRWARRNAVSLAPSAFSKRGREASTRKFRSRGVVCQCVAVVEMISAILIGVLWVLSG